MNDSVPKVKVYALILLTATAVVAPLIFSGYYPGDDVNHHVSLWFETARQWNEGIAYARWAGQATYGYGNPAMVFYPPLSRILGGILVTCLPSSMVLGAYCWLGLVLGGFSFFYLCREFFDDRSSVVAAFAYVINPYNLLVVYIRCAFAEFLAAALFPLFILAVCRLGKRGARSVALLALWIGVIWLTNIPAAIIANYVAAVIVVVLTLVRRSKSLPALFALAEISGTGLAAFYLLPAWYQQPLIDVGGTIFGNPLKSFLLMGGWYHSTQWRDVILNTGFLWQVFVGGVAWFYAREFCSKRRDVAIALTTVLVASILMCLPVSGVVWRHAPFLSYVQFPWRWLFPLDLVVAFFLAAALIRIESRAWLAVAACACSFLIILSCSAIRKGVLDWKEFSARFQSGAGVETAGDYIPRAAGEFPEEGAPPVWLPSPRFILLDQAGRDRQFQAPHHTPSESANLPAVSVQSWKTEARVFTVDSPEPARVRVRLLYYPGWHVLVNGTEVHPVERDDHDAVVVRVPSGHSRVQLVFKSTPDETWGMIVSGLVTILVVALLLPTFIPRGALRP